MLSYILFKKQKTCTVFLSSYTNTSGNLGEREMLWEHEPQATISTAFSSFLFAHVITTSTARASSVSPSSYTNTIFNQSARVLSQDCFLNIIYYILYANNSLHLARKYAKIFACGHYLFREVSSFPYDYLFSDKDKAQAWCGTLQNPHTVRRE